MGAAAEPVNTKAELRRELLAARRQLDPQRRLLARRAVCQQVLAQLDADARTGRPWLRVFAYEALASEPGSPELLQALVEHGAQVRVPVLLADKDLDWTDFPDHQRRLGPDAIAAASVVLVPALSVDESGTRIGRGGGSYDRALARIGPEVRVIALLHEAELRARLPADSWDRRVHGVITPTGYHAVGLRRA